jgi:hypothetical protein
LTSDHFFVPKDSIAKERTILGLLEILPGSAGEARFVLSENVGLPLKTRLLETLETGLPATALIAIALIDHLWNL